MFNSIKESNVWKKMGRIISKSYAVGRFGGCSRYSRWDQGLYQCINTNKNRVLDSLYSKRDRESFGFVSDNIGWIYSKITA